MKLRQVFQKLTLTYCLVNSLDLRTSLVSYKSASQLARVYTENWVADNVYCPDCLSGLKKTKNNTRVLDFICRGCELPFELKSKRGKFGKTIPDGAYTSMIQVVRSGEQPNFLLLSYSPQLLVESLTLIPKRFIVEEMVIKRPPLSQTARRAGWVGCNLNLSIVPDDGKIYYVKDKVIYQRKNITTKWKATSFLDSFEPSSRTWLTVTMAYVRKLDRTTFTLPDLYEFVPDMQAVFPENKNIKPKIRQQLQVLRDNGWLIFLGEGVYRIKE